VFDRVVMQRIPREKAFVYVLKKPLPLIEVETQKGFVVETQNACSERLQSGNDLPIPERFRPLYDYEPLRGNPLVSCLC